MMRYLTTLGILFLSLTLASGAEDFSTPEAAMASLKEAMRQGNFEASDRCYTRAFQDFQKSDPGYTKHRNPQQLKNGYVALKDRKFKVELPRADRAIIRWQPADSKLNPFYLIKGAEGWKVDGLFMYENIVFGPSGWQWKNGPEAEERWKSGQ